MKLFYEALIPLLSEAAIRGVLLKRAVLKNFAKFTRKHLSKVPTLLKETLTQVFSCEFCENFKITIFTKHLWATASVCAVTFFTENSYATPLKATSIMVIGKSLARHLICLI